MRESWKQKLERLHIGQLANVAKAAAVIPTATAPFNLAIEQFADTDALATECGIQVSKESMKKKTWQLFSVCRLAHAPHFSVFCARNTDETTSVL